MFGKGRREAAAAEAARVADLGAQFDATLSTLRKEMQVARDGGDETLENTKRLVEDGAAELRKLHQQAGGGYSLGKALEAELSGMNEEGRSAHIRMDNRREVRESWAILQDRSSLGMSGWRMLNAYRTLSREWLQRYVSELEINLDQARDEIAAELTTWFNSRWANVATDPAAWEELRPLVSDQWVEGRRKAQSIFYNEMGIEIPTVDAQKWNLATVYHKRNPSLVNFIGAYNPELNEGALLLRAADASLSRSFLEAKIVLAYCKYDRRWFIEAGSFREGLAEMVVAMEQGEMAGRLTYVPA